jgi:hypothetical protein
MRIFMDVLAPDGRQAYRIWLTRAMRGAYAWFEDAEAREHVQALTRPGPGPVRGRR